MLLDPDYHPCRTASQTAATIAAKVATVTDPLQHTTTYGYDDAGNLTSVTDPLQVQTTFAYNAAGQQTSVTDALQHTTTFGYRGADLTTITDPINCLTTPVAGALAVPAYRAGADDVLITTCGVDLT